jgi:RecJ-like exonuclease
LNIPKGGRKLNLVVLWTIAGSMGTLSDIAMLKAVKSFDIDVITVDSEDKDAAGFAVTDKKYVVQSERFKIY